ncbi:MAG: YtxH domain-containing protein [Nitrospira sp.]|nr:YtxH domain-containing protein [Nitrospira sp.]
MSDHGKQVSKVAAMIAGGAVFGAGLGLLLAPKPGIQTRRDINRYAKKAQMQAIRVGRTVQSGVKDFMREEQDTAKNGEEQMVLSAAAS